MIDYANLMTQSAMLRKKLGEDSTSPLDIFSLAFNMDGLTLVYYPLGDNLSGMCIKGREHNNLIAINSSMTLGRQRFSLGHEFYHLFYDDSMIAICARKIDSGKDIERSADMFASYFLMPDAALVDMSRKLAEKHSDKQLSLSDVIRIEQYFGVSHQAAVIRLMHTPFLSQKKGDQFLHTAVRKKAEALGYSSELYKPLPQDKQYGTYGNYIKQAEQLLDQSRISNGKYEELLLDAFRPDLVYGDDEEEEDLID